MFRYRISMLVGLAVATLVLISATNQVNCDGNHEVTRECVGKSVYGCSSCCAANGFAAGYLAKGSLLASINETGASCVCSNTMSSMASEDCFEEVTSNCSGCCLKGKWQSGQVVTVSGELSRPNADRIFDCVCHE